MPEMQPVSDPKVLAKINALASGTALPPRETLPQSAKYGMVPVDDPELAARLSLMTRRSSTTYKTDDWTMYEGQIANAMEDHPEGRSHVLNALKSFGGGVVSGWPDLWSAIGGLVGSDAMVEQGRSGAETLDEIFGVDDPTLVDKFANGLGFMTSLLVPSMGLLNAPKLAATFAKLGPKAGKLAHMLTGSVVMGGMESMMEAGDQIDRKMDEGMSRERAFDEAANAIIPNIVGSAVLNMPMFSGMRLFPKAIYEAATEGTQEIYQGYLDDWVIQEHGRDGGEGFLRAASNNWDSHWEEGGIGGAIGFAAAMVFGRRAGYKMRDHSDELDGVTPEERAEREDAAEQGRDIKRALDATREMGPGEMGALRDELAEIPDEQLIAYAEDLRARAQEKTTDPTVIYQYAAAIDEMLFRDTSARLAEKDTAWLLDTIKKIDAIDTEDRTVYNDLMAAHITVELLTRQEISLDEAKRLAADMGIPEWVVDRIPVSLEKGSSPTWEWSPEIGAAVQQAMIDSNQPAVRDPRKPAKAVVQEAMPLEGKSTEKKAPESVEPVDALTQMMKDAGARRRRAAKREQATGQPELAPSEAPQKPVSATQTPKAPEQGQGAERAAEPAKPQPKAAPAPKETDFLPRGPVYYTKQPVVHEARGEEKGVPVVRRDFKFPGFAVATFSVNHDADNRAFIEAPTNTEEAWVQTEDSTGKVERESFPSLKEALAFAHAHVAKAKPAKQQPTKPPALGIPKSKPLPAKPKPKPGEPGFYAVTGESARSSKVSPAEATVAANYVGETMAKHGLDAAPVTVPVWEDLGRDAPAWRRAVRWIEAIGGRAVLVRANERYGGEVADNGLVIMNVDSAVGPAGALTIAVHEAVHLVGALNPDLMQPVLDAAKAAGLSVEGQPFMTSEAYQALTPEKQMEELVARIMETPAVSEAFWQNLYKADSRAFRLVDMRVKSLLKRLKTILAKIKKAYGNFGQVDTDKLGAAAANLGQVIETVEAAFVKAAAKVRAKADAELREGIKADDAKREAKKAAKPKRKSVDHAAKKKVQDVAERLRGIYDPATKTKSSGVIPKGSAQAKDLALGVPYISPEEIQNSGVGSNVIRGIMNNAKRLSGLVGGDPSLMALSGTAKTYLESVGAIGEAAKATAQVKQKEKMGKNARTLAKIAAGDPVSRTAFMEVYGEAHPEVKGSELAAFGEMAADPKTGKVNARMASDILAGDFRNVVLKDNSDAPLGQYDTQELKRYEAFLNKQLASEWNATSANRAQAVLAGMAPSTDFAALHAEWSAVTAEMDRRRGGPAQSDGTDATVRDDTDEIPFRMFRMFSPQNNPRKSSARSSDGPAMQAALNTRAVLQQAAAEQRAKDAKLDSGWLKRLYVDWVDNLFGLKVVLNNGLKAVGLPLLDEMRIGQDPYKMLRGMVRGWSTMAKIALEDGVYGIDGKRMPGKGLNTILSDPKYQIAENYDQFGEYLTSRRLAAIAQARPDLFGTPEAQAKLRVADAVVPEAEAAFPQWKKAAQEINQYANNLVEFLVQAGVLSVDEASRIQNAYSFYAPLHLSEHIGEDGVYRENQGVFSSRGVKTMRDILGSAAIDNPMEAMMRTTYAMHNAGMSNFGKLNVARVIKSIEDEDPGVAARIGQVLDLNDFRKPMKQTRGEWYKLSGLKRVQHSQLRQKLQQMGVNPTQAAGITSALEVADSTLNEQKKAWFVSLDLGQDMIAYVDNGEFKVMKVHAEIYEALAGMKQNDIDFVTRVAGNFTRLLREGAVLSPEFMARNPMRDFLNAMVVASGMIQTPADVPRFAVNWFKSVGSAIKHDANWTEWALAGGSMGDMMSLDRANISETTREGTLTATKVNALKYYATHPNQWRAGLRAFSGVMEESTRIAVYRSLLKKNLAKNMDVRDAQYAAALESREASVDFQRQGRRAKLFNHWIPFFTATIGGMDKLARALNHKNPNERAAAWVRATIIVTIPSILLWLDHKDEEWFKRIPRYEKNMYWHFKTGERIEDGVVHDTIVRYPKPFELGLVFGSLWERMLDQWSENDPHAMESWAHQFASTAVPLNPAQVVPPISAIFQAINNKDAWRNREIVKGDAQNIPARLQYSANTTTTARALGDLLSIAPLKIDFYTRAAFGGVGRHVSDIMGAGIALVSDRWTTGRLPGREVIAGTPIRETWPVFRAFVTTTPSAYDRYSDDFFKYLKKSEGYNKELKWTEKGRIPLSELGRDVEKGAVWMALYPFIRARAKEVGMLTQHAKTVQMDPNGQFTDAERRSRVDEVFQKRGGIMQATVEKIDGLLADQDRVDQITNDARRAFR